MTAGRGLVHSEMPVGVDGRLWGFQLWINLPKKHKMIKPRSVGGDGRGKFRCVWGGGPRRGKHGARDGGGLSMCCAHGCLLLWKRFSAERRGGG